MADEIEHFLFAPLETGGGVRVGMADQLHHRRRRKIKNDQCGDGKGRVERVGLPQFARAHAAPEQFLQRLGPRDDIFAKQTLRRLAAFGHQLLEQRRVPVMPADMIKVHFHIAQQQRARRTRRVEDGQRAEGELPQMLLHHRFVQLFLVLEIIVKQRFVDAGGGGDSVRPRAGQSVPGKGLPGGGEDFRAGFVPPRFLAPAAFDGLRVLHFNINRMVNIL